MTTTTATLTDFLLARIAEDEADALSAMNEAAVAGSDWSQTHLRVLAECEAKRRIVEWHKAWPVLAQTQPTMEAVGSDVASMTYRMSQQVAWLTEQEYRERFGDEPPSAPILRILAAVYRDHEDFREEWRV